ncbi:putative flavonol 3-O-glucosyltransferase [Rosa chinensis]|uniref:Putative flavonol 3-O-glucosyltransferase n=1 Tax=Rosa chinensis TaxID=74649 RepID=A0A2P6QQX6_ROSCH|nr:putative flavonol 3-O-glucosyltransferase [Rosa chinensis]
MHVPWVTSWIGEIRSLFVHIETDIIRDEVGAPGKDKLPQAAAVVVNSFETKDLKVTEELKKRLQKFILVGPLHLVRPLQLFVSDDEDQEQEQDVRVGAPTMVRLQRKTKRIKQEERK